MQLENDIFCKSWWDSIIEDITIPINVGDEILTGKFKNKRIKVKIIGKNEKGDITINGKPILRVRLIQKENLTPYAEDELKRAGLFDKDSDYDGMIGLAVLELIKVFAKQGHSGFSAAWVRYLFNKLSNFQTITPLTNNPDEWMDVTDRNSDGKPLYQSRRNPCVFHRGDPNLMYHVDGKTIKHGIVEELKKIKNKR